MPLTSKGKKIMHSMEKEYGKEKGKKVFYASRNAGKIKGVDRGFYGHMDSPELYGEHGRYPEGHEGEDIIEC